MYNGALGESLFCIIGVSIGVICKIELLSVCLSPKGLKDTLKQKIPLGIIHKHKMENFLSPNMPPFNLPILET